MKLVSILALATAVLADWSVVDGKLSVRSSAGVGEDKKAFGEVASVFLPQHYSLDLTFQTKANGKGARAHQTVAQLVDPATGLHFSIPASTVKPSGNAKLSIGHKSVPSALANAGELELYLVVGSFEGGKPAKVKVVDKLYVEHREESGERPPRMEAKPEIEHVFGPPPKQVDLPMAVLFGASIMGALMIMLGLFSVTGNLEALPEAVKASPFGHLGLIASLVGYELVFVRYYVGTSIFDTLKMLAALTPVAVLAGSRALREVRARRELRDQS
uniref:ARAD1B13090p n=1 Tax=Blastobotrys adeninivorans TaxID=409370 RepID=A0A060TC11_BLAAD